MVWVRIADVDARPDSAKVLRPLTSALGATDVALNYYELAPGDSFAFGYHAHDDQEEIFVVLEGTVTFETEEGDVTVEAGGAVRFGPGEYQQGVNEGDERVVALALGAPKDAGGSDVRRECPSCGERTSNAIERVEDGRKVVMRCLECRTRTAEFE